MSKADTSQLKTQKSSPIDSQPITPDDVLMMVQTMVNKANEQPGIDIQRTSIYHEGQRVAAMVCFGCEWDEAGNLVPIKKSVGNVGNPAV